MPKKKSPTPLTLLSVFFTYLIGKIIWKSPPWLTYLRTKAATKPKTFLAQILGIAALFILLYYAYDWYQSRPMPERIIAEVTPPKLTPNEKVLVPIPSSLILV